MTDRFNVLTVVLDHDMREDDAQPTIDAIRQLRGVLEVTGNVANPLDAYAAESRLRIELHEKILAALYPKRQ